jgi:transposase
VPQATQVADRFHLLQNLAEALDQVFSAHGNALHRSSSPMADQPYRCRHARRRRRNEREPRSAGRGGWPSMNRSGRSTVKVGRIAPLLSNSASVG